VSIAELLQAGHAAVAGVAEKLQRTAKIKRSRIVPQMFLKLPRHLTVIKISSCLSTSYNRQTPITQTLSITSHTLANIFQEPLQSALTISTSPMPEHGVTAAERILVIEDGSAVRRVLKRLFESEGYNVDLAVDGISGLELLRKTTPSALLLDLHLPDISGQEIYQKIIQVAPGLPIIVLSAKTDLVEKVALLEMGAYDYVTKPFSPKELLARVQAALSDRRRSM
jgi:CheY-like chemotaxis protein